MVSVWTAQAQARPVRLSHRVTVTTELQKLQLQQPHSPACCTNLEGGPHRSFPMEEIQADFQYREHAGAATAWRRSEVMPWPTK